MALKIHMVGCDKIGVGYDSVTGECGPIARYINGTGGVTVKGSVYSASITEDNKVILQGNEFDAFCVCAQSGIANDAYVWCWTIGAKCQMLLKDGEAVTRGQILLCSDTDGRCLAVDVPNSNPVVAEHFKEIAHAAESKTSGTNVLVLGYTHYN